MKSQTVVFLFACALALLAAVPAQAQHWRHGAVYTMTNDPMGNGIVVFSRQGNGYLTYEDTVSTGGIGSGGGLDALGSQGSLVLSKNKRWLLAVNAGSNEISVFKVLPNRLTLVDKQSSSGLVPVSLTLFHNLVYVLNNGTPNLAGFTLSHSGKLIPLSDSVRSLNGTAFSQVGFDNKGQRLVVTDRGNQKILVFSVGKDGSLSALPAVSASEGAAPFGFLFDRHNHLLVSEAGAGAVSSYNLLPDDTLRIISGSVANRQMATCWIASTQRGFGFTANTGSNTLSAYQLFPQTGILKLRQQVAGRGTLPLDLDTAADGRFLYVLNAGSGTVGMFRITRRGTLVDLGTVVAPLALYSQGMAAR